MGRGSRRGRWGCAEGAESLLETAKFLRDLSDHSLPNSRQVCGLRVKYSARLILKPIFSS